MTRSAQQDVQVVEIQKKIREHFGTSIEDLLFEFTELEGKLRLDLITVNPRHSQSFLFHSVWAIDRLDAMQKMLDYVREYRERENSYTVQWKAHGDAELHTSYFRANNIYEALDKLYYDRDMNLITVFSVVLNPVS